MARCPDVTMFRANVNIYYFASHEYWTDFNGGIIIDNRIYYNL